MGCKELQGVILGYKGLQGVTGGSKGFQGVTKSYRGLQGVTGGYKGLQEVTWGCKGLHETKIFVIVVDTCVCRHSVDNKALILSYPTKGYIWLQGVTEA